MSDQKPIDNLLNESILARIATIDENGRPHVVPVWFGWDGECLWISAYSSTHKVRNIQKNPWISVVIDTTTNNIDNQAVVLEGKTELVRRPREFLREKFTWIYARYLGNEGVLADDPQEWINDNQNLLIKMTPEKVISWGLD